MSATKINVKKVCGHTPDGKPAWSRLWLNQFGGVLGLPNQFIRLFQEVTLGLDASPEAACERYVRERMAVVRFQMTNTMVKQIRQEASSSYGNIFSTIGQQTRKNGVFIKDGSSRFKKDGGQ